MYVRILSRNHLLEPSFESDISDHQLAETIGRTNSFPIFWLGPPPDRHHRKEPAELVWPEGLSGDESQRCVRNLESGPTFCGVSASVSLLLNGANDENF